MKKVDEKQMMETAERVKNWGKWGKDDEVGTLNYVTPKEVAYAAGLVTKGKVFALGMNLDSNGPQSGREGRYNPIHAMMWTGTDFVAGREIEYQPKEDYKGGDKWYAIGFADDYLTLPLQCATHWDALGHIFFKDLRTNECYMYNGFSPKYVGAQGGCTKSGVEKYGNKMAGRGVLLDMARFYGKEYMLPGEGITAEDMEACAKKQGVEIRKGDFLLIRTGDADRRIREKNWGTYCGGNAPGLEYETIIWLHDKEIAAIAIDTWGVEVRPNRTDMFEQPWHWLCIPMAGLPMGENFRLDELADDCAEDKKYEFLFIASPLLVTGGTASPLNPYVLK
ncbi:MAG: cyclase family protein [Christensenellales bacterium]